MENLTDWSINCSPLTQYSLVSPYTDLNTNTVVISTKQAIAWVLNCILLFKADVGKFVGGMSVFIEDDTHAWLWIIYLIKLQKNEAWKLMMTSYCFIIVDQCIALVLLLFTNSLHACDPFQTMQMGRYRCVEQTTKHNSMLHKGHTINNCIY